MKSNAEINRRIDYLPDLSAYADLISYRTSTTEPPEQQEKPETKRTHMIVQESLANTRVGSEPNTTRSHSTTVPFSARRLLL